MKYVDEQFTKSFCEHCYDCSKITNCINAFRASQSCNCEHWDTFANVIEPVEKYVNECLYNQFIKMMEEVNNGKSRNQNQTD